MKYEDLLNSHLKYGTTKKDIIIKEGLENILENVIIAPWWSNEMFDNLNLKKEQINEKLYNFYGKNISFSFVELKQIGAAGIMDLVLSLGVTKCKNLIFLGSVGSLDKDIKIGDIVIPKYSICGDGASRYLNKNLEDDFLKEFYPTKDFTDKLINVLNEDNIKYHYVPNFSIDTVFAQYYHLDKILNLKVKTIEMETANVFKCSKLMNINVTALFCISDNTILNKSLYSGRNDNDKEKRHKTKYKIVPKLIIKLFEKMR